MNLKVGDKVYCKKSYVTVSGAHFMDGYYYEIGDIVGLNEYIFTVWLIDHIDGYSEWDIDSMELFDYFCTEKELRKQKLDEIESR